MKRYLLFISLFLFTSCGKDSTSPSTIDFQTSDQIFIDDLAKVNDISDQEIINERIISVDVDSGGATLYKIRELNLSSLSLDSIPQSIGTLDSLKILILRDNNLQFITESICSIYDHLDSLVLDNNKICTPTIPECIEKNTTITHFYGKQGCEILPDEGDKNFITDMIDENWLTYSDSFIDSIKSIYTTWETFWDDEGALTYRITEIRYNDTGVIKIPNSIADLDSLIHLELQDNEIDIIPDYISSLSRLEYFAIFKNKITSLPAAIGNLTNLEVLKVSENQMDHIDEEINMENLGNLHTLWISDNNLTTLPAGMCGILDNPNIEIFISNNSLCDDLGCFSNLINESTQPACPE